MHYVSEHDITSGQGKIFRRTECPLRQYLFPFVQIFMALQVSLRIDVLQKIAPTPAVIMLLFQL